MSKIKIDKVIVRAGTKISDVIGDELYKKHEKIF